LGLGGLMPLVGNFIEKDKGIESFTKISWNKRQISRLLDYHISDPRLYNLDYKLVCLVTIQII
jgi:hypothetical protein